MPFVERTTEKIVISQQYPNKRKDCKCDYVNISLRDQIQHGARYSKQRPRIAFQQTVDQQVWDPR